MPFRTHLSLVLGILSLGSVFVWLLYRVVRSKGFFAKIKSFSLLTVFLFTVSGFASLLLPCFNLYTPAFCRGDTSQKKIALTFDDGPNEPYTSQILDTLRDYHVPATFFLVGQNVLRYPETVRRIEREGHVIGNHTFTHSPMILMKKEEIRKEIEGCEAALQEAGVHPSSIIRTPHGWRSPFLGSVLKEKGYRLMGWTRGVWDSDQPGVDVLFSRLSDAVSNGAILLLHDGEGNKAGADRSQTAAVLPRIIEEYRKQGFQFVTLAEMVEIAKGKTERVR